MQLFIAKLHVYMRLHSNKASASSSKFKKIRVSSKQLLPIVDRNLYFAESMVPERILNKLYFDVYVRPLNRVKIKDLSALHIQFVQ